MRRAFIWVRSWYRFWFAIWWTPVRVIREIMGWRRRAEVAEAVAAERHHTIELLTAALQARSDDTAKLNGAGRQRRGLTTRTTGRAADS